MKRIFLFWCFSVVGAWAAPSLSMTSAPTNVASGQSYTISAQCWDSWGGVTVTIYKDNVYFASTYGSSPVSVGGSTSDTGPKTVTYRIEAVNDYWETDTIYHYVTVAAPPPPNNPPTISWVTNPSTVSVNQNFTVQAKGVDSDGNLTNVYVWRDGSPFAFNGGGNGYENTSDGNLHSQSTAGTITFTAQAKDSNNATSLTITHTVTVTKLNQTITFNQPAAQTYGGQLSLSASASSGLGVSFSVVSGPASLSGNTLTFTGTGSVVVRASQGGNGTYNAASNVDRTITVNKANQTITFNQPSAQTYGGQLNLSASSSSGLTVGFSVVSGPASLSGNTLTFTGVGSVVVRASQSGNANYNAASNVDRTITVNKANQTITFNQPSAQSVGDQLALSASSSSGLAVSFSLVSGPASLSGNTLTFTGQGNVVVRASQSGNTNYNAASNVDRTISVDNSPPTVAWHTLPPTFIFPGDWFPVRATGSDTNGNLSIITVEYRVNGGSWQVLAYDPAGSNGGNGSQTTSNANGVTAGTTGTTYQFRSQAYDTRSKSSAWLTSGTYTVLPANTAPSNAQISARQQSGVTYNSTYSHYQMDVDGTITIDASVDDAEGNLVNHSIWRILAPPSDSTMVLLNNGSGGQPNTTPTSGSTSSKTVTYVPTVPGRYDFHTNGQDSKTTWGSTGASITVWAYGPTNDAQFISQTLNSVTNPTTLSVNTGQSFNVSVTVRNTGDKPWTTDASPHRLSAVNGLSTWGSAYIALPATTVYPYAQSGTNTTFSWTATAPTAPGTYTFQWRMKEEGVQWFGDTGTAVTITVVDTIAPTTPGSLQSTGKTTSTVSLSWSASTDNSGAVTYAIYRNGGGTPVGTTTNTTFTDTSLTHSTTYSYTVKAYDAASNYSAASNSINVTTDNDPNADDDGDGIPNGWESANGLNPGNANDGLLDPDGDGLTNAAEYNLGTNPQVYDEGTSTLGGTIPAGWPNAASGSSYVVGMTAGSLEVDKNGAATYSIPLWVVPGTAGMEPKLALNYSSQAGAGWLGHGWSLSGLSSITRGPQTKALDNNVTGVNFTSSDRFYLDGQRLVYVGGGTGYGTDNAEYRTEIDSISKIVSKGSAGSGPLWFQVWTKSGLIIELGNTTDSAVDAQGRGDGAKLSWAVNKISDTSGNYIEFVYSENTSTGEHRIDRINYTGNAAGSLSPYASVRFNYENRTDTFSGYVSGSKVSRTQRIKSIGMYYGETKVRDYVMDYVERSYTGRSILTTLHEKDGSGAEYPPMTFEYDEAPSSSIWDQTQSGTWAPPAIMGEQGEEPKGTGFVDLNGDGRPDFVQYHRSSGYPGTVLASGAWINTPGTGWVSNSNYIPPSALAHDGVADSGARFVDLNSDGLADFVNLNTGSAYLNTGTGFETAANSTWSFPTPTMSPGLEATAKDYLRDALLMEDPYEEPVITSVNYVRSLGSFIDIDHDGRPDFVGSFGYYEVHGTGGGNMTVSPVMVAEGDGWRNTGSGWERQSGYGGVTDRAKGTRFMDVNADGHLDSVQNWYGNGSPESQLYLGNGAGWTNMGASHTLIPPVYLNTGTLGNENAPFGTEAADINGDGLVDLLQYNGVSANVAYLGTGTGWVSASAYLSPIQLSDNNTPQGVALLDINSDGLVDIVQGLDAYTRAVRFGTGNGWSSDVSAYHLVRQMYQSGIGYNGTDFVDLNADGAIDQIWWWKHTSGPDAKGVAFNNAKPADRLKKVTNGFGVAAQITYAPLTERDGSGNFTVYDKGTGGPADTVNAIGPMYVVKTVSNDDGAGGQYAVNYRYGGLRSHLTRGSLGFEWTQATDSRTGIVSKTTYKQEYPYIGMVASTETKSGSTVLSSSTITYADRHSTGDVRLPYAATVAQVSNDLNGASITSSTTTTTIDEWGNATNVTVSSGGFTKTTTNTFQTDADGAKRLGRLTGSTVASAATGKSTITRTSSFTYHATTGLLETETVEPGDNTLKLTTTYGYDAFGNKTSVTLSGAGITVDSSGNVSTSGTVSRQTTYQYDSKGRFLSWKRAYKDGSNYHQESYTFNQQLGVLESLTGPNGLTTEWTYNSFGVKTGEERADGTVTAWTLRWAGSGSPAGAHTSVEVESTGSAPSLTFNDNFGRPIWALAINGDGTIVWQQTAYDSYGRAYAKTNPYRTGDTIYWTQTTSYDLLNRPLAVQTPHDSSPGYVTTTYSYNGTVNSGTDPKGRVTRTTVNSQGWTTEVVRNYGGSSNEVGTVTYDYDAIGNLTSTVASGVTTTLTYDLRGRKTSMTDPNMGTWQYRYNIFGELIWQKDAKGQITELAYDGLGRLTSRVETEGTTTWTYDSASAGGAWKGKLYSVSAPGSYSETYNYDSLGRPTTTTKVIDSTSYVTSTGYDSAGRPNQLVYPATGLSGSPFKVRQVYNAFGFLKEVRHWLDTDTAKANDELEGKVYWQADHYDASGRIDGEIYGNGLANDRIYSAATGRLLQATIDRGSYTGTDFFVQNLGYSYDQMGNVTVRDEQADGYERTENFAYDPLDRLTSHAVSGGSTVTVTYDAKGNLTYKSDLGSYSYHGTKVHAVVSAGTNSYTYDANGNMLTGGNSGNQSYTWTSFNQVKLITNALSTKSTEFFFGANHERVKQVRKTGSTVTDTTIYVGSLYEKVTAGSLVTHKHYIMSPTGRIAVFTDRSDFTKDLRFFHTDGLGSITVISDEAGRVLKRYTYDAWGKQSTLYTNTTSGITNQAPTTRGFTDHEELSDFGLVHMNGRIYDPVLGRFLSADPFVDGATDSQGYNRYSYVGNNPLGATDPTGFVKFKEIAGAIVGVVVAAVVVVAVVTSAGTALGGLSGLASNAGFFAKLGYGLSHGTWGLGALAGGAGGFASGFSGSLLNGGSIGDAFKAGAAGAVTGAAVGGIAHGIGNYFNEALGGSGAFGGGLSNWSGRTVSHALVGGLASEAQGGQFRHGFYSSFASTGAMHIPGVQSLMGGSTGGAWIAARTTVAATIGGTASVLAGGKFANGAVTSAFQHLFNQESTKPKQKVAVVLVEKELADQGELDFWNKEATRLQRLGKIIVDTYDSVDRLEYLINNVYDNYKDQLLFVTSHGSMRFPDLDFGMKIGGVHVERLTVDKIVEESKWNLTKYTPEFCSPGNLGKSNYALTSNVVRGYFGSQYRWKDIGKGMWRLERVKE